MVHGALIAAFIILLYTPSGKPLVDTFSYLTPLERLIFISLLIALELFSIMNVMHGISASWFLLTTYRLQGNLLTAFTPFSEPSVTIDLSKVSVIWSFRTLGPSRWSKSIKGHLLVSGDTVIPMTEQIELWKIVCERCQAAEHSLAPRMFASKYSMLVK